MVHSQFAAILKEFEAFFGCPLAPDAHDSCLIKMKEGISIQMELDRSHLLLIVCRVGTLPMGRYRDQVIQQALKSNEASLPSTGIFGFAHRSSLLILFIKLDPATLSGHQIPLIMSPFIAKAKQWADAITRGDVPIVTAPSSVSAPPGLFGLIK